MSKKKRNSGAAQLELVPSRPLDEWYVVLNKIYLDRNYYRSADSIFVHLVEIVGGLSLIASKKRKPNVTPEIYIPKALGWWMALCGKLCVRSVEEMIWSKFPYACPYCYVVPHDNDICGPNKAKRRTPDWAKLAQLKEDNKAKRPHALPEWVTMFSRIYPVQQSEEYSNVFARITEETGELAEATRLFHLAPGYFFSEASDFFAWLMHLHLTWCRENAIYGEDAATRLVDIFYDEYPGFCGDCGNRLCACPPVLRKTSGRIAKEMPFLGGDLGAPPLFNFSEAIEVFQLSDKTIQIAEAQLDVTTELIQNIDESTRELKRMLIASTTIGGDQSEKLVAILDQIQRLAEAERATQKTIDELAETIKALPSESQTALIGILTNVAAGPWVAALLKFVEGLGA